MQKNPCRVDDPLQNPIDRESYEDAVSLEDGIYPITTDDNTIISSDMVKHGSGTVEDALNAITPTVLDIPSVTSDANGFVALGISNDRNVLSVSSIGYSFLFWKRSNGYWHATVLNGSNVPVPNSTFNNVKVLYI